MQHVCSNIGLVGCSLCVHIVSKLLCDIYTCTLCVSPHPSLVSMPSLYSLFLTLGTLHRAFLFDKKAQTHLFTWTSALDHGHTQAHIALHRICNQSGKIPNLSLNGDTEKSFKRARVSTLENHMFLRVT